MDKLAFMMTNMSDLEQPQRNATPTISQQIVSPCLGPRTGMMIVLVVALQLGLADFAARDRRSVVLFSPAFWLALSWIATMRAGWAISIWMVFRQPIHVGRIVVLSGLFLWHSLLMAMVTGDRAERAFLVLGIFGLLQIMLMSVVAFPVWRKWGEPLPTAAPRRQFSILSMMVLTTLVAGGLVALRRYNAEAPQFFLPGHFLMSGLLLPVSACAFKYGAGMNSTGLSLGIVTLVAAAASVIASCERHLMLGQPVDIMLQIYTGFFCLFGWWIWAMVRCGRADSSQQRSQLQAKAETNQ